MEQNHGCSVYEESKLVQTLINLHNAATNRSDSTHLGKKALEYQKQRKICVGLRVDVTEHDARAAKYTQKLKSCPLFLE